MRWYSKIPQVGDCRTRRWFALFPTTVYISDSKKETRWLQWVTVKQEYVEGFVGVNEAPVYFWSNEGFIDD